MHPHRFGRFLRRIREEQGWTQEEMARQLGISRQALFLLETGRGFPSIPLAMRIARLCRRSLDDMFTNHYDKRDGKEVSMRHWFDPFSELDRLHRELDRMFGERFRSGFGPGRPGQESGSPAVNVRQTEKEVIVEAQLPGVAGKDLQVNVTEDRVSLKGERKSETSVEEENFVRREYSYGSFSREIMLPTAVKAEEALASMKNGLLTIRVPKKEETEVKGRELTIKEE